VNKKLTDNKITIKCEKFNFSAYKITISENGMNIEGGKEIPGYS